MADRGGNVSRLLVLGGGLIGRRHVERILAHPNASCAGLVEPDPGVAPDLDVPRFADLSQAPDCDGVVIATPSPLHAEHGVACAQRGMAVLIEKPVTTTLADADRLIDAAHRIPALVGHHRRHHGRVKALKALLDSGEIGDPVTVTLIWAMGKPDAYFDGNWRSAGGSPVMINLVHDLDLLRYWFGDIAHIAALPGQTRRDGARIDSGAVALRLENGATATISFADSAPSPWGFEAGTGENPNIGVTGQDMMWITGTKGAISFPSLTCWRGTDWSRPAQSRPPVCMGDDTPPLDTQLDHFLDVIAGTAKPACTLQDGRAALAAALEIEAQLHANLTPALSVVQA